MVHFASWPQSPVRGDAPQWPLSVEHRTIEPVGVAMAKQQWKQMALFPSC
jgi:hypothetical protein